jgi:hypothetical protein
VTAHQFFSHSDESGFKTHATAEEAKARALAEIEAVTDETPFDADYLAGICWGEITEVVDPRERELTAEEREEHPDYDSWSEPELARVIKETCMWQENLDGAWDTACGKCFELISGDPVENGFSYCPGCGKGRSTSYADTFDPDEEEDGDE